MKIAGKSFIEYLVISKIFWVVLFFIMGLMVVIRLSIHVPVWIQAFLSASGAAVLIRAGWTIVKRHGYDLRQVSVVALVLSLAVHWSLPIFHGSREVLYLILINSVVYTAMVVFGGLLAMISAK